MNIQFSDLIENAPHAPGVYKMYDSEDNLLYVGKAKNLSNRLPRNGRLQLIVDSPIGEVGHDQSGNFIFKAVCNIVIP